MSYSYERLNSESKYDSEVLEFTIITSTPLHQWNNSSKRNKTANGERILFRNVPLEHQMFNVRWTPLSLKTMTPPINTRTPVTDNYYEILRTRTICLQPPSDVQSLNSAKSYTV